MRHQLVSQFCLWALTLGSVLWGADAIGEVTLGSAGGDHETSTRRPNVVLVLTDDQGWGDLGVHGNRVIQTPHLDRFARKGVDFHRYYSSPVCSPTRASLMTGRYYYRTGVLHTSRGGAKMSGDEITLAEVLAENGYQTGIFGKWHLGDTFPMRPMDQGFGESLIHKSGGIGQTPDRPNSYFNPRLWKNGRAVESQGYCTDLFFEAALDFLSKNRSNPFFVYLALNAPHTPLEVEDRYVEPYRAQGIAETTAKVYGMIQNLDENFGRMIQRMEAIGVRDHTAIFFLGDNGPQQARYNGGLRGRKSSVYEGGIRSIGLMQWPGQITAGRQIAGRVAHIDIFPTVLDIATIGLDGLHLDGISLLPLLNGQANRHSERSLFFQCHRGLTPTPYQNAAVMTARWKLVMNEGQFSNEAFHLSGESGEFGLFEIDKDREERINLAQEKPEVVALLVEQYRRWFQSVKESRGFEPGTLVVGSVEENPVRLCRYQDGRFDAGTSQGWDVEIVRGGRYHADVVIPDSMGSGHVFVEWQGRIQWRPYSNGRSLIKVDLAEGKGRLDIWAQADGEARVRPGNNSVLGDVVLTRVEH